jgi:hypothetical protein
MKQQSNRSSAFFNPSLQISLLVLMAAVILAVFGNAFARDAKSAPKTLQTGNVKDRIQRPAQNFWAQTNGPQGGDGIALATNASGHVFVGTQGGGIFRSTDSGETWTGVNNGLTATNVRALAPIRGIAGSRLITA